MRVDLLFSTCFLLISSVAVAETTTIEKMTMQPGEVKKFTIETQSKIKIGFNPNTQQAKNCKNNCFELSQEGGSSMASKYGGAMGMKPKNGKVEGSLKNLEAFPLEVELFRK